MHPAPHAQHNDQQRLHGMHYQRKGGSIGGTHAVEHHHGDDGKVPRARTVGRGDYDGKRAAHKHHQPGQGIEVGGKAETIKREEEVQIVARPDADGVQHEQGQAAHPPQGEDALPHVQGRPLHFLKDGQRAEQVIK